MIKTGFQPQNRRIAILLLVSIGIHALVFINYKTNDLQLPAQAGSSFTVTLNEIHVQENKQPVVHQEQAVSKPSLAKKLSTKRSINKEPLSTEANSQQATKPEQEKKNHLPDSAQVIAVINQQLDQYFYYPVIAKKRNWQGKVILAFRINHRGKMEDINVIESSGYEILDMAAVTALNKINQINAGFSWPQNGMNINLPVIYKLKEG